ncbi:MAG: hypothetical protein EZS28_049396, partial [Streblomastix strix]
SYFNPGYGQIGQTIFKHCLWNSNGLIWNSQLNDWQPTTQVESGAIVVQYADFPTELKYAIDSDCNIRTGKVVLDSCSFINNVDFTSTSPNRNMIIDSTSNLIEGDLTQFVAMMLQSDPVYNIMFKAGIMVNETTLNVRFNKLSITKEDDIQEEVIFRAKQTPTSPNYLPFQENGAFIDPFPQQLFAVEQSGEISMKSIVILHFYEKSLNSVIQVKDEAKFNGIQLIFRPIEEQLSGMAIMPTTEQTSPYLQCLGGFTILESCQFLPTAFINSAAIRTMHEIG